MARTLAPVKTPGHAHIRARMRAPTHGVAQHGHNTSSPLTDTHPPGLLDPGQREEATKWHSGDRTLSCDSEQIIVDGLPTWLQFH